MSSVLDAKNLGFRFAADGTASPNPVELNLKGEGTASPAFALLRKEGVQLGRAAFESCRTYPGQTVNRFWSDDPSLPSGLEFRGRSLSQGLLAYQHFRQLLTLLPGEQRQGDLSLMVPREWSEETLNVALSALRDSGQAVDGLVSRPLAIVAGMEKDPPPQVLVLDLHLHGATLSALHRRDGFWVEETPRPEFRLSRTGWDVIWEKMVTRLRVMFMTETGIDLSEDPVWEQRFFNALVQCLDALTPQAEAFLGLTVGGHPYRMALSSSMVSEIVESDCLLLGELIARQNEITTLLVTADAIRLPGLMEVITRMGKTLGRNYTWIVAPPSAPLRGALRLKAAAAGQPRPPLEELPIQREFRV
jgi:hypothetical protein